MFVEIISKLISHHKYRSLNGSNIYTEVPKDLDHEKLENGSIKPCGRAVSQLLGKDIEDLICIVAQMGHEAYFQAMLDHPDFDIIIGMIPAPYAAIFIHHGFNGLGIAYHIGNIME
jgi:hypothetical protein